jgi:hypothetical protein
MRSFAYALRVAGVPATMSDPFHASGTRITDASFGSSLVYMRPGTGTFAGVAVVGKSNAFASPAGSKPGRLSGNGANPKRRSATWSFVLAAMACDAVSVSAPTASDAANVRRRTL